MQKISKIILLFCIFLCLIILFTALITHGTLQLLSPQGYIADIQSNILIGALILGGILGCSIVAVVFFTVWHYREGNHKALYAPDWSAGKKIQILWWIIPFLFIIALSVVVWDTAHEVDPYRPIPSTTKPITIQVVALQWKWLFLYPSQHIATVNFLEIPTHTPIAFQLTADAPMNSFWIPRLSGQIYAMTGMVTQLHVMADTIGTLQGGGAEMSGEGFAGMQFPATVVQQNNFTRWVKKIQSSPDILNQSTYDALAKPTSYAPAAFYQYPNNNLYNTIIMKFMPPSNSVFHIMGM